MWSQSVTFCEPIVNRNPTDGPFKIIPFKNRGKKKTLSYRVSGTLLGVRVQKNFPTPEAAQKKIDALIRTAAQGHSLPTRYVATRFKSDEELHEAELAHQRLVSRLPGSSLMAAVEHYLQHHSVEITTIPVTQAITDFKEARSLRGNRENTIENSAIVLRQFLSEQKIVTTADFTKARANDWIHSSKIESRTRRDRYDLLVNFAKFLKSAKHLAHSPLQDITRPRYSHSGVISYFTVAQCQRLLDAAAAQVSRQRRGVLLPYISLCLFSGLRPQEARRMGEDWSLISLENRVAQGFLPKTGAGRTVELLPPLDGILARCQAAKLAPGSWSRQLIEGIQKEAGLKKAWDNDILRHTYASHHFALHGDLGFLVRNMGNSETVLGQSYINRMVPRSEAEKFFHLHE